MSTTDKYREIKDTHIPMHKCFFAFDKKQELEGKEKAGIMPEEKILSVGREFGFGLYGTQEGLDNYFQAIKENRARVPKECNPQDVYDYEFINHECSYVGDDEEAIKIVIGYYGAAVAKTVKRRCAYREIDSIIKKSY